MKKDRPLRFNVHNTGGGWWTWDLLAPNGKTLAFSASAFRTRRQAIAAVDKLMDGAQGATVLVEGKPRGEDE